MVLADLVRLAVVVLLAVTGVLLLVTDGTPTFRVGLGLVSVSLAAWAALGLPGARRA